MAEVVYKGNMAQEALDEGLIEQFKNKPRFKEWLTTYLNEIQPLEDIAFELKDNVLDLDAAEGAQLDIIGEIVGEERFQRDDDTYRTAIYIRILVNGSGGEIDTLNTIIDLFFDGTISFLLEEVFPAGLFIRLLDAIDDPIAAGIPQLANLIKAARGAGINTHIIYAPTGAFQYDAGPGYDVGKYGTSVMT